MNVIPELKVTKSRLQQSGVADSVYTSESLSIEEVQGFSLVRMRAVNGSEDRGADPDIPAATGDCCGQDPAILCLGPGEWVIFSETRSAQELLPDPRDSTGQGHLFAWDQTDGLAVIRIGGEAAPWLMRKNSALDFHVTASTGPHCAQCKFGKIGTIVHFHRDENGKGIFDLVVDRSLARYLWTLLVATARHARELENDQPTGGGT